MKGGHGGFGAPLAGNFGRLLMRGEFNSELYGPLQSLYEEGRKEGTDVWIHKNRCARLPPSTASTSQSTPVPQPEAEQADSKDPVSNRYEALTSLLVTTSQEPHNFGGPFSLQPLPSLPLMSIHSDKPTPTVVSYPDWKVCLSAVPFHIFTIN